MKKIILTLVILAGFAVQALAHDFQSGNLLYTIISTDPPCVSLSGHADGTDAQGELVIPETVENEGVVYTVTDIGWRAFYRCSNLTGDLVIPNTITHIAIEAFAFCTGFTGNLVISNNIIELGNDDSMATSWAGVFQECNGFTHLSLPESVEVIGFGCFNGCTGLKGPLLLHEGIREIKNYAFGGCSGFSGGLVLPSSLEKIWNSAFRGCTGLTGSLVIPETVEEIGSNAFAGCSGFDSVVLPSRYVFSLNELSSIAVFAACKGLTSVEIPEGWERIVSYFFEYCSNLVSVRLPQSLKRIEGGCFDFCTSLSEINIPEGVTQIGVAAFAYCVNLTEFDFPDSLSSLGQRAFDRCSKLSGDLKIPKGVEWIHPYTFDSCVGYTRLVLGPSLNRIAEFAFQYTEFESIVLETTTPPQLDRKTNENAWHFPADIPITVPCGTLEAYRNAEGWSEFTNMHEGPALLLSVVSENEGYGSVRVLKEATCEDVSVEVEALPNEGCAFLYWEANGVEVATDNPYSFVLEEDTELVARFSGAGLDEMDPSVCFYPNPTTGMVTVRGENLSQAVVTDLLGQQVLSVQGEGDELQIDMTALPAGVYLVTVTDHNGRKCVRKAVRE